MTAKHSLKRIFITTIIASLSLSALCGIFALLFGSFGALQVRVLITTLVVGIFSITSLANLRNLESEKLPYRYFAWASITFSMLAMIFSLTIIWVSVNVFPRLTMILFILAVSTAHTSLLLPKKKHSSSGYAISLYATITCITLVALILIGLVLSRSSQGQFIYKILGVFAILDVFGTIVTPIIGKLTSVNTISAASQPAVLPNTVVIEDDNILSN